MKHRNELSWILCATSLRCRLSRNKLAPKETSVGTFDLDRSFSKALVITKWEWTLAKSTPFECASHLYRGDFPDFVAFTGQSGV